MTLLNTQGCHGNSLLYLRVTGAAPTSLSVFHEYPRHPGYSFSLGFSFFVLPRSGGKGYLSQGWGQRRLGPDIFHRPRVGLSGISPGSEFTEVASLGLEEVISVLQRALLLKKNFFYL